MKTLVLTAALIAALASPAAAQRVFKPHQIPSNSVSANYDQTVNGSRASTPGSN